MIFEKRLDIIREMLENEEKISNKDLLKTLCISESTLRRDLDYLEEAGEITRVHGGAVLRKIEKETNFKFNETSNIELKKTIGKKAASLVKDGDFIFLDGGTTTHQVLDYISASDVTIVTNGIMHLNKLNELGLKTILIGGEVKHTTLITYGELAIDQIANFSFDLAFIGANGIGDEYYSTADIHEAMIKKAAIKKSRDTYILADSSKFNKNYFVDFCKIDEAKLITEEI